MRIDRNWFHVIRSFSFICLIFRKKNIFFPFPQQYEVTFAKKKKKREKKIKFFNFVPHFHVFPLCFSHLVLCLSDSLISRNTWKTFFPHFTLQFVNICVRIAVCVCIFVVVFIFIFMYQQTTLTSLIFMQWNFVKWLFIKFSFI